MDKLSIKDLLSYLREHITLIIIFVSLIGGLGQFYNLVNISAELLNFYSVSQVLIKGVFYLFLTLISFISTFIMVYFMMTIDESNKPKFMKFLSYLFLVVIQILLFYFYPDYVYLIFISFPLSFIAMIRVYYKFKTKSRLLNSNKNDTNEIFLIITILIFACIFMKYEIVDYIYPTDKPIKMNRVACKNNNECYNLKYYNDKYAFYVLTKKDSVNGENSKVIVKKLDDVIETKNYKLYEDELSFSKAKNDSFNQVLRKQDSIFEIEMKKSRKSLDSMTKELQNSIEDYKKSLK
ncbi:hypothetical protein [Empedobacter sp. 189-2]|uniref:hypothetical protein n=1 Tax=Empedobacter sp. 189-2 TaxID=2746724 RepID=UPI002576DE11|nr:hypothetical protein [Empedobacter sp. 189-2]MDM1542358.1 hypothetical protein [Empedobacter sp. 189-2]